MTFCFSTETVIATQREHSRDLGRRSMTFQDRMTRPSKRCLIRRSVDVVNYNEHLEDFVRDSNGTWVCIFVYHLLTNATYRQKM
ncbi:Uncharacterized protein APZ42_002594 [Daphnia magna]|uniref:Uncharacterized protein n=1 Tax=Daphnia magna TaxID=35525 RepID=A0A162C4T8_9CRUS|nr:Uncharacterized protein APZ42_002594 [Daphnia magna]